MLAVRVGFLLLLWFPGRLHAQGCDAPDLTSGFFIPENQNFAPGSRISYTCDEGFKPAADSWWETSTCQSGTWVPKPQCVNKTNCFPPEILHADYQVNPSGSYEQGEKIRIRCHEGYETKGQKVTAKCANGTWSLVLVCNRKSNTCGEPPRIDHGVIIQQRYKSVFAADSTVLYECQDRYTLDGVRKQQNATCIYGVWVDIPTCRVTEPVTEQEVSAVVQKGVDDPTSSNTETQPAGRGTQSGTGHGGSPVGGADRVHTTSISSKTPPAAGGSTPGTGHGGDTSGSRRPQAAGGCQDSNDRNCNPTFTTINICGAYPTVPNAVVVNENQMFLEYQCTIYYTLDNSGVVRCLSNGKWSHQPICKEAFCALDPAVYPEVSLLVSGVQYLHEGVQTFLPCIWRFYSSEVICKNGRVSLTKCCLGATHSVNLCKEIQATH
ncbi:complement factor H-like [Antennarius striatus]|uniref:complement factor H-like n=1 Tax=Antennarius striatus TaxID=241820 RepID=UPI0035B3FFBD